MAELFSKTKGGIITGIRFGNYYSNTELTNWLKTGKSKNLKDNLINLLFF